MTSATYGLYLGTIWRILAFFTRILAVEKKCRVTPDLVQKYQIVTKREIVVAGIFYVSILPQF